MLSNPSGRGLSRRRLVGLSVAAAATGPLAGLGPAHAAASAATVTVFASGADRIIGREFVGLAYEKYALTERLFTAANTDLVGLFRSLGPGLLRIGGATVDMFIWTPGGQGRTHRQIAPADVDALAGFLRATGWRCLYGINLAGASTNATSPAMAADEVRYATGALGPSLAGIEIGNEPEFYGAGGYFPEATWTVQTYETLWRIFRDTIVHINPKVAISGPGCVSRIGDWTAPFAVAQKGRLHMVTQHYYRGNGLDGGATAANLVTPDTRLPGYLDALKRAGGGAALVEPGGAGGAAAGGAAAVAGPRGPAGAPHGPPRGAPAPARANEHARVVGGELRGQWRGGTALSPPLPNSLSLSPLASPVSAFLFQLPPPLSSAREWRLTDSINPGG